MKDRQAYFLGVFFQSQNQLGNSKAEVTELGKQIAGLEEQLQTKVNKQIISNR